MKSPLLAGLVVALFTLAACGSAAAPAPTAAPTARPSSGPDTTPRPTPTPVPGVGATDGTVVIDPGNGGGSGGGAGGAGGNTGGGIVFPIPPGPNIDPLVGAAKYLQPAASLINQHAVNVQLVRAVVANDGTATADLRWWSGVAPCSQLDSIKIERDDAAKTIRLKVIEGSGPGEVACIDIAQLSAAAVDLGKLAPGTWTISAEGDAPAIKLDVP
jgi:hypothetical protein